MLPAGCRLYYPSCGTFGLQDSTSAITIGYQQAAGSTAILAVLFGCRTLLELCGATSRLQSLLAPLPYFFVNQQAAVSTGSFAVLFCQPAGCSLYWLLCRTFELQVAFCQINDLSRSEASVLLLSFQKRSNVNVFKSKFWIETKRFLSVLKIF
jgi:hypothetical protein